MTKWLSIRNAFDRLEHLDISEYIFPYSKARTDARDAILLPFKISHKDSIMNVLIMVRHD